METTFLPAPTPKGIREAGDVLRRGGLVAIPTETVYGLAADAFNGAAVAGIFRAKGRPQDNPLIVHIGARAQLAELVREIPEAAQELMDAFWPGPLTLILPKSGRVPQEVSAGLDTVAVRFPAHPVAQAVINAAGVPLAAPSANTSGRPSPTTAQHVWDDLAGKIDAVLDGGACAVGIESTVVDVTQTPPRLLRPGAVTLEQLRQVVGEVLLDDAVCQPLAAGQAAASPGMKYKHYAPKARLLLVEGDYPSYRDYVNAHAAPGVAALCYPGEEPGLLVPAVTYGAVQDEAGQARELFDALRRLDGQDISLVYARCPGKDGVGLAVYNRLLRAAGFEVIALG